MLKFSKFALLSALLAFTASVQAFGDKPEALVNGEAIPKSRVDLRVKIAAQQNQPDSPELRKAILDELISLEFLSQAAVKKELDEQPEIVQRLAITRQNVLADALVQDYIKDHPVTDEQLKQEYEVFKNRIGKTEYKLAHILVDSEDEAKKIAARLKNGSNFSKLAKKSSKDPSAQENGGELGWTIPAKFVQPFAEAIPKLKRGQVSAPVQTQFGWHIIKLEDIRDLKVPSLADMKPTIENSLHQQAVKKYIDELRSKAKIE
jgi:peptidyl-prolyl cis-trans isomerase C